MDAPSPLGISWVFLVLLMVPLLLVTVVALAVVRRREIASPRVGVVLVAAVAAAAWTFFTAGAPVRVPDPRDPEGGAECVNFEHAPINWSTDCGTAFAEHLVVSGGPSLLMFAVSASLTAVGLHRRASRSTPVAAV